MKVAACGIAALSSVHTEVVDTKPNREELLAAYDKEKILTMNEKFCQLLVNGSHTRDETEIDGFYAYLDKSPEAISKRKKWTMLGDSLIDAGGTGDNCTSILLINWHPMKNFCFFPQGTKAGIRIKEMGQTSVVMPDGSYMPVYQTYYYMDFGLCIRDERECVRAMNIDMKTLNKNPEKGGADIIELMTRMIEALEDSSVGRPVFYVPRPLRTMLRLQTTRTTNVSISMEQIAGRKVLAFDGIPMRRLDAITTNEVSTNT